MTAALSDWAVKFCAASATFDESVKAIPRPKDQSVDEQKRLAPDVVKRFSNAVDAAVSAFSGLKPPDDARPYHESTVTELKKLKAIEVAAGEGIARAKTSADIQAVGKTEESSIQQASTEFDGATKETPADVVTALKAVKKCGSVHP